MEWSIILASDVKGKTDARAVAATAVAHAKRIFRCSIGGFLFNRPDTDCPEDIYFGLRETHAHEYSARWRTLDPVLNAALQRRIAVRNTDVLGASPTGSVAICTDYARRVGAGPYMVVPVYGFDGTILATMHVCRLQGASSFDLQDLLQALGFSGVLSAMLARVADSQRSEAAPKLAPREYEIALVAARGLSNPVIAKSLGIARETVKQTLRRVYNKFDIQNRTELAALCTRFGWL